MRTALSVLCCVFLFSGCRTNPDIESDSVITNRLTGAWFGETAREDGSIKKWRQERRNDGTFSIVFYHYESGNLIDLSSDSGFWWVSRGIFYERYTWPDAKPFVYILEWKDDADDCLTMRSIARDERGDEYDGYTFSECRFDPTTNPF